MSIPADRLLFPADLTAWERWARRQKGLQGTVRAVKDVLRPPAAGSLGLYLPAEEPKVLVVIDHLSPTARAAVVEPLGHMDLRRVALLTGVEAAVPASGEWHREDFASDAQLPRSIENVLSLGAHFGASSRVEPWARRHDKRFCVVQHGLNTPFVPPLNPGAHVFTWAEGDGEFWASGRRDVTWEVVGSQLLWEAAQLPAAVLKSDRPIMLGQLHGTELPRREKLRIYEDFCRRHDAEYRPHPGERDIISRLSHRWMRARGVRFEESGKALVDLGRPVVSIFSTGTLEAAQRGLPAWVHHPNPPGWLRGFWDRYGLEAWGPEAEFTKAWEAAVEAPAATVAGWLLPDR